MGDAAVSAAYGLARRGTVVHLLHVVEPAFVPSPLDGTPLAAPSAERVDAATRRAESRLQALVPADAEAEGVRTEIRVVSDAGAAEGILAEAKRVGAQAIVLGSHGRTGLGRMLLGSVAAEVARRSDRPVVTVTERG
jgi:nucleotide-binding universal stress UspA family protein